MLKKTTSENRNLFLQLFTKEIMFHIRDQYEIKKRIEQEEKLKEMEEHSKKLKEPIKTGEEKKGRFIPSIIQREVITEKRPIYNPEEIKKFEKPITKEILIKPTFKLRHKKLIRPKIMRRIRPAILSHQIMQIPPSMQQETAGGFDLGKLNPLIRDNEVTMIECSGPGKPLVVKKAGRVNSTQIAITQEEIDKIIEIFSEKARIPVIGGVFKASVGNLTLSAVISRFVGSRFILTKDSPYSLLEQQTRQVNQAQQQSQFRKHQNFQRSF